MFPSYLKVDQIHPSNECSLVSYNSSTPNMLLTAFAMPLPPLFHAPGDGGKTTALNTVFSKCELWLCLSIC